MYMVKPHFSTIFLTDFLVVSLHFQVTLHGAWQKARAENARNATSLPSRSLGARPLGV
jgi:hypothetical protein